MPEFEELCECNFEENGRSCCCVARKPEGGGTCPKCAEGKHSLEVELTQYGEPMLWVSQDMTKELAYIAITPTGFVDGACFTQSPDADDWVKAQEAQGMEVKLLPRDEAKRVLFTQLENA